MQHRKPVTTTPEICISYWSPFQNFATDNPETRCADPENPLRSTLKTRAETPKTLCGHLTKHVQVPFKHAAVLSKHVWVPSKNTAKNHETPSSHQMRRKNGKNTLEIINIFEPTPKALQALLRTEGRGGNSCLVPTPAGRRVSPPQTTNAHNPPHWLFPSFFHQELRPIRQDPAIPQPVHAALPMACKRPSRYC